MKRCIYFISILVLKSAFIVSNASASELSQLIVKDSVKLNEMILDSVNMLVIDGNIVSMRDFSLGSSSTACSVMYFQPVKAGETFKIQNVSDTKTRYFKTTLFSFQGSNGMIGFGIRCMNKNFETVNLDQVKMHFQNIVELR